MVALRSRVNRGDSGGAVHAHSPALLTIPDVASHTKVSPWTVRTWIDSGKLPVLRLPGRLVRIDPAELQRFLDPCR
jgi:excisionase family DNA binding protein